MLRDPKHWRDRASTARAVAGRLAEQKSKQRMLGLANEYEKLAELAEIQAKSLDNRIRTLAGSN